MIFRQQDIKNSKFVFDQVFHEEEDSAQVYQCVLHEKLQYVCLCAHLPTNGCVSELNAIPCEDATSNTGFCLGLSVR